MDHANCAGLYLRSHDSQRKTGDIITLSTADLHTTGLDFADCTYPFSPLGQYRELIGPSTLPTASDNLTVQLAAGDWKLRSTFS